MTLILFLSVYWALYILGAATATIFEIRAINAIGWIFVALGVVPLIISLSTKYQDAGYPINEKKFPKLIKLVREVSQDIGVRFPDEIQFLPTEEIYVSGLFKRKLGIGIVNIRALSTNQFKSILAHEFGHLYGNDTIVGNLLSRIQLSLEKSSSFGKSWWNAMPFMEFALIGLLVTAFAKTYSFIFRLIISIYSKQVEYRADYIAVKYTDKETFGNALLNVYAYSAYFDQVGYKSATNLLYEGKYFKNIYEPVHDAYLKENPKDIKEKLINSEKTSFFSSHPSVRSRLSAVGLSKIDVKPREKANSSSIFDNFSQLEVEMTSILNNELHTNMLYADAVARDGKCRYCGEQHEQLNELLDHESRCDRAK